MAGAPGVAAILISSRHAIERLEDTGNAAFRITPQRAGYREPVDLDTACRADRRARCRSD
jgi:hypothetical protein